MPSLTGKDQVSRYYRGWLAQHYNQQWRGYTEKTLAETLDFIDFDTLRRVPEKLERAPRALDVACGTGVLLRRLLDHIPEMEAWGVDASADMLAQAKEALQEHPQARFEQVKLDGDTGSGAASLPLPPQFFDLITCTNALHDIHNPQAFLTALREALAPGGQLVLEDFAQRQPAWLWTAFEWLTRRIEGGRGRAFTLSEAQILCSRAGWHVACVKSFQIDWLWHGWALRAG